MFVRVRLRIASILFLPGMAIRNLVILFPHVLQQTDDVRDLGNLAPVLERLKIRNEIAQLRLYLLDPAHDEFRGPTVGSLFDLADLSATFSFLLAHAVFNSGCSESIRRISREHSCRLLAA
jgi:hypothetical protein